ncbi:ADP-ribosyltransferase domain-containing protein [Bacteroides thetaiotaomicron]|uniref:ADP-ribosyltransferase domain-containing protein n=1 Tax=Bacteroides thetaiotaomicron TaxID=818 RepID=UPI00233017C0|nr:ADP-ribosyltransferase domain-containing protein [Bacteroides thetaiotaomicron]MDC2194990.1 ADP-ribosyltransferase domain-containing protein [Bacteroides thetaiotaomicron]
MAKYVNSTKLQKELFKRTEGYSSSVRNVYIEVLSRLINLVKGTELEDGKPFSFSDYGYGDEATAIFRELYSRVYQEIRGDVEKEWMLSNTNNDELVKSIFGAKAIEDNHFARFFQHNKEAMNAFFSRKTGEEGLSLSQKVWKYTGQYRDELENALDLAIGEGTPANKLASKIQKYLQEPDKFYRRFRVKTGEDEDGNPVYGRIWKRRVYDKESEGYKWVDDNPKKYHPGRGVYRSSYRNAQRLARTETNIAYRTADYERWQQLDFVVGIEIKLSNNHPTADICDDLKGIYPKAFQWKGWHPNCRCYMVPVLATEKEMDEMIDKILSEDVVDPMESSEAVQEYPQEFQTWVKDNEERMEAAKAKGTLPYFIKDNKTAVEDILNPLTPEQKHHKELVSKYGEESVQQLYNAFDSFKEKISTGDLAFQIKKLTFEKNWVAEKNKFPTSPEMVKLLEKELISVQGKYDLQQVVEAAQPILGYKSKSKPLNSILDQLNDAIANGSTKEIQELTAQATTKIHDIEKARLAKLAKTAGGDGSTLDLYATAEEKLEIARLQDLYDKAMAQYGSQWNYNVNGRYKELAEYKKELSLKYVSKQGKLVKLNGETEDLAKKALEEYVNAPTNNSASSSVGGRWQLQSSERYKITEYSKLTGISEDELGLINRYTYGSKWCNNYGYGIVDSYFGKVQDYGGLCQKYYPAHNAALEKMPRYNGTVFSGISFDTMTLNKYVSEMKDCLATGKPFVNKAFMSSTTDITTTSIFGDNVMLVIKSKKGVDVKAISHYASEDEIVFRAGSNFKVLSAYQETTQKYGFGKGWVIELEEM